MKTLSVLLVTATIVASSLPVLAASVPPPGAASCSGCHSSTAAASPVMRLYGRDANEIVTAMTGFRDGSIQGTVMNRIAKGFSDDELHAIAAWLAAQK